MTDSKYSESGQPERQSEVWRRALAVDGCPPIEELLLLAEPDRSGPDIRTLREHLQGCSRCRSELQLFEDFERAEESAAETEDLDWLVNRVREKAGLADKPRRSVADRRPALRRFWNLLSGGEAGWGWRPLAGLAVAALVVAVIIQLPSNNLPPLPEGPSGGPVRSRSLNLIQPLGTVTGLNVAWRWEAVSGADRYLVRVFEVDQQLLWEGRSRSAALTPPPQLVGLIRPGKRVFWQVTAYDRSGEVLATSEKAPLVLVHGR